MRILQVVHQYLPEHIGGTELYTQSLAGLQARNGHSVAIFSPSDEKLEVNGVPAPKLEGGVWVYRYPTGSSSRTEVFLRTFTHKQIHQIFAALLSIEKPDLVHIQHLMGLPMTLIRQANLARIPFVITVHDYWFGCANAQLLTNYDGSICNGPDKWFYNCGRCALARAGIPGNGWLAPSVAPLFAHRNRRLQQVLRAAQKVIAPSQFVIQTFKDLKLPTDNMVVIPHGIAAPNNRVRSAQGSEPSDSERSLHIGYIGSLAKQKGVHNLIAAVNRLPPERIQLSIYGGRSGFPDYVRQLERMAEHPGIRFAGAVSREDLWSVLAELDVLVLPTLWYEASPLTVQEAFAAGLPIVASRIGAMEEKITDNVDGLLVPPDDVSSLRDALESLLTDPGLLAKLRAGIRPVRTIEEHGREIEALYRSALRKHQSCVP